MNPIVIQRCVSAAGVPAPATLRTFARAALGRFNGELTLRIVGEAESRALNKRYRRKDKPTNVLSFPHAVVPLSPRRGERPGEGPLGDLVICARVVAREAKTQGKNPRAHWAHMVVHGCLHLLGHNHEVDAEAVEMEVSERKILKRLGFPDPYA